jgi:transposase
MSPGRIVLALVIDALSGRSPLFRLSSAFSHLDTGLLLGKEISPLKLNDDAVGRALDRVYEVGTGTALTAICLRAVKLFDLDTRVVRHDTTSHSVYGAYEADEAGGFDQPFKITFGFSKKHRPDLKQLVHSLLCRFRSPDVLKMRERQRVGQDGESEPHTENSCTNA